MEERRHAMRTRSLLAGKILLNGGRSVIDCVVRNLSDVGACLQVASLVGIPLEFDLVVDQEKERRPCTAIWRAKNRIGIEFRRHEETAEPPEPDAEKEDEVEAVAARWTARAAGRGGGGGMAAGPGFACAARVATAGAGMRRTLSGARAGIAGARRGFACADAAQAARAGQWIGGGAKRFVTRCSPGGRVFATRDRLARKAAPANAAARLSRARSSAPGARRAPRRGCPRRDSRARRPPARRRKWRQACARSLPTIPDRSPSRAR